MRHVNVKLKLANPVSLSGAAIKASALVDAGATFTTIPRHMSEKLGLRVTGKRRVRTASGLETLEQSFASVEINSNLTGQLKEAETYLL